MPQSYTVKSGDNLSSIAARYGVSYQEIAKANNVADPNKIFPGQTFNIPDKPGTVPAAQPAQPVVQQQQPQVQSGGGVPPVDMSKYAGWNDQAAIQADWNNTWQSKTGGGQTTGTSGFSMPSAPQAPNFQAIYDKTIQEATNTFAPQITEAQTGVDTVNKQIADRTAALNVALGKINDNPYYSEATRVGRARKLQEQYNNDVSLLNSQLGIASNKLTNTQNMAEKAKADAQVKINIASNQYNIENQQYQQQLQQINSYLSAGMFNNASGADIAQISTSTGMSTSMVQSIIDASKKSKEEKPKLETVDDGTNQYVVAFDSQGNVINKQVISTSKPKAATADDKLSSGNFNNAQVSKAINILAKADELNTGEGTGDGLLSEQEKQQAILKIQAEIVPDRAMAEKLFILAGEKGNFNDWNG